VSEKTEAGLRAVASSPTTDIADAGVVAFCARPLCRREFRRNAGPGRPQAYCSEPCRRSAEREYRQALSRLSNYEAVVDQLRIDIAAFGKDVDADVDDMAITPEMRRRAEDAVEQARGAVPFLRSTEEPAALQLCSLYDAVAPLFAH
jgi:hypothetical protein